MAFWLYAAVILSGIALCPAIIYIFFKDHLEKAKKNDLLRRIVGISLVILGIIGIFLPVLQGWLMIFLGLSILRIHFLKKLAIRLAAKLGVHIKKTNKIYKPKR